MTPASARPCPCTSGAPYRDCCGPFHAGQAEAPDAERLMRSRFAAFAAKQYEYLHRTLHPDHPDRAEPKAEYLRAVARACAENRYLGLTILDRRLPAEPDADATALVLFRARVFRRGRDQSFVERSEFRRAEGGWRYLRGDLWTVDQLGGAGPFTLDALPPPPGP